MRPVKNIEKKIKNLRYEPSAEAQKRVFDNVYQAMDKHEKRKSGAEAPGVWRIIMKSRISKFAAVAAVITMLLAFDPFGIMNSGGVAWAEVAQRVEKIETFMFGLTIKVSDPNNEQAADQTTARWIIYLSEKYGFRMDMGPDEKMVSWFVAPDANEMIMVVPSEKQLVKRPLPADIQDRMPEEYTDPREYISSFLSRPYKELGRSVIDEVQVEGIEVKDPPTKGERLENAVGRLWVDTENQLPVRIEIEGTANGKKVQWIMDFKWAKAVDPALFDPN